MNFSPVIDLAWQIACAEAVAAKSQFIEPEHFLETMTKLKLLCSDEATQMVLADGVDISALRPEMESIAGVLEGVATDLEIEAKEILRLRSRLYDIIAKHTGKNADKIEKDCDRNLWLEAEEAIKYGLVDEILQKAPEAIADKDPKN